MGDKFIKSWAVIAEYLEGRNSLIIIIFFFSPPIYFPIHMVLKLFIYMKVNPPYPMSAKESENIWPLT